MKLSSFHIFFKLLSSSCFEHISANIFFSLLHCIFYFDAYNIAKVINTNTDTLQQIHLHTHKDKNNYILDQSIKKKKHQTYHHEVPTFKKERKVEEVSKKNHRIYKVIQ